MRITVRFFGSVKDDAGVEQETLEIADGSSVSEVVDNLVASHENISKRSGRILFALNQNYCSGDTVVRDNDELALFPIVSGG